MANNFGILGSGIQKPVSKGRRSNTTGVSFESPEKCFGLNVIDLSFSIGNTDCKLFAFGMERE